MPLAGRCRATWFLISTTQLSSYTQSALYTQIVLYSQSVLYTQSALYTQSVLHTQSVLYSQLRRWYQGEKHAARLRIDSDPRKSWDPLPCVKKRPPEINGFKPNNEQQQQNFTHKHHTVHYSAVQHRGYLSGNQAREITLPSRHVADNLLLMTGYTNFFHLWNSECILVMHSVDFIVCPFRLYCVYIYTHISIIKSPD